MTAEQLINAIHYQCLEYSISEKDTRIEFFADLDVYDPICALRYQGADFDIDRDVLTITLEEDR